MDAGDVVVEEPGTVEDVSAEEILVRTAGKLRTYDLIKFRRTNQGTNFNQKPSSRSATRWSRDR